MELPPTSIPDSEDLPPSPRRLFCNRTLNLRSIRAIGCDMDYTLIHYKVSEWERRAFEHSVERLVERGWKAEHFKYDPEFATRGLVLDLELGNIVKANRFGYVVRACHGTQLLSFEDQKHHYGRVLVDLSEPRWQFTNTLFSLSELGLYAQAVDLLDQGKDSSRPDATHVINYADLYRHVRDAINETHLQGELKAEIIADPDRFVELDAELPLALLDMKHAGKQLLVITNSEWSYTKAMMNYAFDRFLPGNMTWRELFDLTIVQAAKPAFFSERRPVFEIVDEEGLLQPVVGDIELGKRYLGGHAGLVETCLGIDGENILYVGDHIFADVRVSKDLQRWRTMLVVRELEEELEALEAFKPKQQALTQLMDQKERLEHRYSHLKLQLQRLKKGYGPQSERSAEEVSKDVQSVRASVLELDAKIGPLAAESGQLFSERWGLLMRSGTDKSHFARQIERAADAYTSRVSNLLWSTPYIYLRAPRGSLPHDGGPAGGA